MGAPRVLVVGTGGIGGIVAARLIAAGHDAHALTTNVDIANALRTRGFVVRDPRDATVASGPVAERVFLEHPAGKFDIAILATQPPQVEAALAGVVPALHEDATVVVLQNGLCERRLAALWPADAIVGAIVAWGASMPEAGVYEQTAAGGFTLGTLEGKANERCYNVGAVLQSVNPVRYTDNLLGARLSKLALNCAISSLGTLAGCRLGELVDSYRYRRLALAVMAEVVAVASAMNVSLEPIAGTLDLPWLARPGVMKLARWSPATLARHAMLWAVGKKYRRMRSSMLSALERGRTPAVDFLNGEIVSLGQTHGVPTPINARIVAWVWQLARGEHVPSKALLDRLCAESALARAEEVK